MFKNTKKLAIAMLLAIIVNPIVAGCKNGRCSIRPQVKVVTQPIRIFALNQVNVINKNTGLITDLAELLGVDNVTGSVQFNPNNNTWTLTALDAYNDGQAVSLQDLNTNVAALNATFIFQSK